MRLLRAGRHGSQTILDVTGLHRLVKRTQHTRGATFRGTLGPILYAAAALGSKRSLHSKENLSCVPNAFFVSQVF